MFMLMLAAFQVLLYRYTQEEDLVLGDTDSEPEAGGDGRLDRVLRQHAGAAH